MKHKDNLYKNWSKKVTVDRKQKEIVEKYFDKSGGTLKIAQELNISKNQAFALIRTYRSNNQTRRRMLQGLGIATAAVALGTGFYYVNDDEWLFLEDRKLPKIKNMEEAKSQVPTGVKTKTFLNEDSRRESTAQLKELVSKNIIPSQYYQISTFCQTYIRPDEPAYAKSAVAYAKKLIDFFESELKFSNKPLTWIAPKVGDAYKYNYNGKAFVGSELIQLFFNELRSEHGELVHTMKLAKSHYGGSSHPSFDKDKNLTQYYLHIVSDPVTLYSPISEYLPFITGQADLKPSTIADQDANAKRDETICEAISNIVALKAAKEFSVPNGVEIIQQAYNNLIKIPIYDEVPLAKAWIKKNGLQNGFDLYMESPIKFMEKIKS